MRSKAACAIRRGAFHPSAAIVRAGPPVFNGIDSRRARPAGEELYDCLSDRRRHRAGRGMDSRPTRPRVFPDARPVRLRKLSVFRHMPERIGQRQPGMPEEVGGFSAPWKSLRAARGDKCRNLFCTEKQAYKMRPREDPARALDVCQRAARSFPGLRQKAFSTGIPFRKSMTFVPLPACGERFFQSSACSRFHALICSRRAFHRPSTPSSVGR